MKKILEVLQYGDTDVRFNTDFDPVKDQEKFMDVIIKAAMAMSTTLWGGNELAVLAMIRALSIADLAVSVNRKEMIEHLDESSGYVAKCMEEAREEARKRGINVQVFGPGIRPPKARS